jgi:hypothetical protein
MPLVDPLRAKLAINNSKPDGLVVGRPSAMTVFEQDLAALAYSHLPAMKMLHDETGSSAKARRHDIIRVRLLERPVGLVESGQLHKRAKGVALDESAFPCELSRT